MAKEIIDKIVKAEEDGGKVIAEASEQADLLKASAAAEADAAYKKVVAAATEKAAEMKQAARKEAENLIREAEEKAQAEKQDLLASLSGKMEDAAGKIIASL